MPEILFSSRPRTVTVVSPRQEAVCNEERSNMVADETDMDFFIDDYAFTNVSAADGFGEKETAVKPSVQTTQTSRGGGNHKGNVSADCDVCIPLCRTAGNGQEGFFVICVPAALPAPELSLSRTSRPDGHSLVYSEGAEEEEKMEVYSGAAWCGRSGRLTMHEESLEAEREEEADAAHSSGHGIMSIIQHGLLMRKKQIVMNSAGNIPCSQNLAGGERGGDVMYCMQLPSNFVFGLRLPPDVEMALKEHCCGEKVALTNPPVWLFAFLYTRALGLYAAGAPSPSFFSTACRGLMEEATAVATLEGFCIVAFNVVAQIGHLHWRRVKRDRDTDETTLTQNTLLHDDGLFSATQEGRIQRWLQRYMPMEIYSGEEKREKSANRQSGCGSWPSAVAVVFHIALDLVRALFPSLLMNLESAILSALQPLLEACVPKLLLTSSSSSSALSLRLQQSRKQAIMLLTQGPVAWWGWWEQNDNPEGERRGYNTSAVSTSRGYAAIRVLQCFTSICFQPHEDASDYVTHGEREVEEEYEVAQFLLSAPALFTKLLLDREVMTTLARAAKGVSHFFHVQNERGFGEEAISETPRVKHALVRCFIVLLCWLAFRPEGYSQLLAQKHFGSLVLAAALQHERQKTGRQQRQHVRLKRGEGNEESLSLLGACSYKYLSLIFFLLRDLRDRCGTRQRKENCGSKLRVNPWRILRHGGCLSNSFFNEDDRTTNTSHSHRSMGSYCSAKSAIESDIPPCMPLTSNNAMSVDNNLFSSSSTQTLRRIIRQLRSVLCLLQQDIFVGQDTCTMNPLGIKRQRDVEVNVPPPAQIRNLDMQCVISPQLAYHVFNWQDCSLWEWHIESDSSSEDDTTDTSTSGSS